MKFELRDPPRRFTVGAQGEITLSDCGRLALQPDEQVTFVTAEGAEYDVVRKDWGFYATPSINGRLQHFGWRSALVLSPNNRLFLLLVAPGQLPAFQDYLRHEGLRLLCWLDDPATLRQLAALPAPHA